MSFESQHRGGLGIFPSNLHFCEVPSNNQLKILWALSQYFVDRTSLLGVVLVGLEFKDIIF